MHTQPKRSGARDCKQNKQTETPARIVARGRKTVHVNKTRRDQSRSRRSRQLSNYQFLGLRSFFVPRGAKLIGWSLPSLQSFY